MGIFSTSTAAFEGVAIGEWGQRPNCQVSAVPSGLRIFLGDGSPALKRWANLRCASGAALWAYGHILHIHCSIRGSGHRGMGAETELPGERRPFGTPDIPGGRLPSAEALG